VDVPARVAETGASVEEAARELRYDALQVMAHETGCSCIATAHTADDQAETVLMRLLRGAGVNGLAGIPPRRDNIIRPLLDIWRAEVEAYLAAHDLPFRLDATNLSTEFFRNRIRLELLPLLERDYSPRLRQRLARLAEGARLDAAYLDALAAEAYARHAERLPGGVALPLLTAEHPALRRRVWRLALEAVRGGLGDIGYEHLAAIEVLRPREEAHLPGARVIHEAGKLVFLPADEPDVPIPETPLPVPGAVALPGCRLIAACLPHAPAPERDDAAVLDAAAVEGPLRVRGWQPGDRYRPFGAPGSRKLQDIFVDAGVPKRLRPRVPVVLDAHGIIWLAGFRMADRVKMVATTTATLRLQIIWEYSPWTFRNSSPG
jgi:tRNA(Ile)-lysidine synthase